MTDKEFLELLMSYQAGKVPLRKIGLALANNQFGHEYVALAGNILTAEKASRKSDALENASYEWKETALKLRTAGV